MIFAEDGSPVQKEGNSSFTGSSFDMAEVGTPLEVSTPSFDEVRTPLRDASQSSFDIVELAEIEGVKVSLGDVVVQIMDNNRLDWIKATFRSKRTNGAHHFSKTLEYLYKTIRNKEEEHDRYLAKICSLIEVLSTTAKYQIFLTKLNEQDTQRNAKTISMKRSEAESKMAGLLHEFFELSKSRLEDTTFQNDSRLRELNAKLENEYNERKEAASDKVSKRFKTVGGAVIAGIGFIGTILGLVEKFK